MDQDARQAQPQLVKSQMKSLTVNRQTEGSAELMSCKSSHGNWMKTSRLQTVQVPRSTVQEDRLLASGAAFADAVMDVRGGIWMRNWGNTQIVASKVAGMNPNRCNVWVAGDQLREVQQLLQHGDESSIAAEILGGLLQGEADLKAATTRTD